MTDRCNSQTLRIYSCFQLPKVFCPISKVSFSRHYMHYLLVPQHGGGFAFSFVLSHVMTSHEKALHYMCVDFKVRHLEDLVLNPGWISQSSRPNKVRMILTGMGDVGRAGEDGVGAR